MKKFRLLVLMDKNEKNPLVSAIVFFDVNEDGKIMQLNLIIQKKFTIQKSCRMLMEFQVIFINKLIFFFTKFRK